MAKSVKNQTSNMPFITIHTNFDTRRYGFLPPSRWPEAHSFLLNLNKKEAGWVSEKREHKRHSEMTRSSPAPAMVTRQPNLAIQLFKMFHGFQLVQLFPFHSYGEAPPPLHCGIRHTREWFKALVSAAVRSSVTANDSAVFCDCGRATHEQSTSHAWIQLQSLCVFLDKLEV